MPDTTTTLIQPILGMEPYILLTAHLDADNDLSFQIQAGGGVESPADVRLALLSVLSGMGPLSAEELAELTGEAED